MTALQISEKQWQLQVRDLLALTGFELVHGVFDSRHSPAGWPDICALRHDHPGSTVLIAELKSEKGRVTPAQQAWLTGWSQVAATVNALSVHVRIVVGVFRPSQWDELVALLTERQP